MSSHNTPPPFRFSTQQRAQPPRSSAAKTPRFIFNTPQPASARAQFASTPRFVLSQLPQHENPVEDDINGSDEEPPSSFSPALRRGPKEPYLANRNDAIDDLEEEEEAPYDVRHESDGVAGGTDNETGSFTGDLDIDTEFDILFPSTPSRRKRRRISPCPSPPPRQLNRRTTEVDQISSASDASLPASPEQILNPASPGDAENSDSAIYQNPSTPRPAATAARQPHQSINRPRFVFPLHSPFRPSQDTREDLVPPHMSSTAPVATTASTSRPQRSRPHFILPPSPPTAHEDNSAAFPPISIPEPFSPSRHRGRHDGQSRGTGTNFVAGGMAVEVRGWILEMGAKVQQQHQLRETNRSNNPQGNQDGDKYLLSSEVDDARCGYKNGAEYPSGDVRARSGVGIQTPITLVRPRNLRSAQAHTASGLGTGVDSPSRNLLLLGPPCSSETSTGNRAREENRIGEYPIVQKGSTIGVRRGFTWEIEVGGYNDATNDDHNQTNTTPLRNNQVEPILDSTQGARQQKDSNRKWLVGVEWDVLG
ncbi:hypothetical protein FQN54_002609 [Arachnomyces sp. PD_36]|nr:hypothetical protein FQN54_002609 [Arachnomyces sp. PD_36]